ncbi:MAG: NAD(P)H-dependent oxidoreductase subunit E [Eubacterium sp.]|nr:NAD(P)H-dependent oxidoreductase subunit E [Eubacterium sp.]
MEAKKTVPFKGTKEQEAQLYDVINRLKDTKAPIMPILQQSQDIYGYLPIEVQQIISNETGVPLGQIYGIVTFYSMFNLYPKGEYRISVCLGTACYVKGSGGIFEKFKEKLGIDGGECTEDGKYSLDACRCVGACGMAPIVTVNDEVFGRLTVDDVDDIIAKFA